MTFLRKLSNEKLKVIIFSGVCIVLLSFMYGQKDFHYKGYGLCSSAWDPYPMVMSGESYVKNCKIAASGRREEIYFFAASVYIAVIATLTVVSWSIKDDSKKT